MKFSRLGKKQNYMIRSKISYKMTDKRTKKKEI